MSQQSSELDNKSTYNKRMYHPKTNRSKEKNLRITKSPIVIRNEAQVKKVRFEAENIAEF